MRIRKQRQNGFTTVDNAVLNDTNLSWKAKGLFVYLWSQADEWDFYESEVVKHSTDGLSSLKSGIKELEKQGYLRRERKKDDKGYFRENAWILSENPMCENPMCENRILDNRTLTNTNNNNTNNNNTNYNITTTTRPTEIGSIYEFWESNVGSLPPLSPYLYEEIQAIYEDWSEVSKQPKEMILESIKLALDKGVRNISYIKAILKRWHDNRIYNIEDLKADQERFEKNKESKYNKQAKKGNAAGYDAKQWTYLSEEEEMRRFFGDN
nr:MAG TPA: Dna polymerase B [Caudoviricetes sp.]